MKKKLSILLTLVLLISAVNLSDFKVRADLTPKEDFKIDKKINDGKIDDTHFDKDIKNDINSDKSVHKLDVSFELNEGSSDAEDQTVKDGRKIQKPSDPVKKGYDFLGWRIKDKPKVIEEGEHKGEEFYVDFDEAVYVVGNESWQVFYTDGSACDASDTNHNEVTLEAVYEEKAFVKVTFNTKGGSPSIDSQIVYLGEKIVKPQDPVKEGYVFSHWSNSFMMDTHKDVCKLSFDTATKRVSSGDLFHGVLFIKSGGEEAWYNVLDSQTMELIAIYKEKKEEDKKSDKDTQKYKVTFETDGGEPVPAVQEVAEGAAPTKPADPKKDGFVFDYWAFDNGERTPDFSMLQINEDITLKAVYKKADSNESNKVTVRFDAGGGSPEPASQRLLIGKKVSKPETDPSKENYQFIAWYDVDGKYDFTSPVERDMILYAKYSKEGESHKKSNRRDIDIDDKDYDKAILQYKGAFFAGYPDDTFKPENTITRAEMATVFARILGLENKPITIENKFSDIGQHWAKDNILRVAEFGLLNGYPDGTFNPEGKMKRGEIASIINKYWEIKGFTPNSSAVNISDIDKHWAKKLIQALFNHRFVDLYEDKTFKPDLPLIRADVAQILNRITDRKLLSSNVQKYKDVPITHWAFKEVNTASTDVK